MNKRSFNWGGIIVIVIFVAGLIYFFGKAIKPDFFLFASDNEKITVDSSKSWFIGFLWLIIGVICVPMLNKTFSINATLAASAELTASVKVISKCSIVSPMLMPKTNVRVAGVSPFISFEFPDGSRKNFRIENIKQFNSILEGEEGLLIYKAYKNNLRFISFDRQT